MSLTFQVALGGTASPAATVRGGAGSAQQAAGSRQQEQEATPPPLAMERGAHKNTCKRLSAYCLPQSLSRFMIASSTDMTPPLSPPSAASTVFSVPPLSFLLKRGLNFIDITRTCHSRSSQGGHKQPLALNCRFPSFSLGSSFLFSPCPLPFLHLSPFPRLPAAHLCGSLLIFMCTTIFINNLTALPKLINFNVLPCLLYAFFSALTPPPNPLEQSSLSATCRIQLRVIINQS